MSRNCNVPTRTAADPAGQGLFQSIESALASIRQRAYEIFRSRGEAPRNDLDDWFRAERELFEIPPGELAETADGFVVTVAAPDFKADQLAVAIDDDAVTIRGEAEVNREKTGVREIYSEFSRKELFRRFAIPGKIDADKVKSNFADGYLKVTLPRIVEAKPALVEHRAAA